ncbi:hypothetical protein ABIC16_004150 [Sphingomonas sp. PvP055]
MEAGDSESVVVVEEATEEPLPGRSMRVAAALRAKGGDEFAKPGNIIEVKFVKGESLSLTASRLLALMILTAGGDAWEDKPHRMRKADIRRGHKGNERITDMLQELHRTLFLLSMTDHGAGRRPPPCSLSSPDRGKKRRRRARPGGLNGNLPLMLEN